MLALSQEGSEGLAAAHAAAQWIWLAVALPLAGFLVNGALALWRPTAKKAVSLVGPGVLLAAFAVVLWVAKAAAGAHLEAPIIVPLWDWIGAGDLRIPLAFQVDQLSIVMLLVVTGVGSLIHLFSVGYMHADEGYARYFAYLNLFVANMLVLVLGDSLPVLFIGWEGVGLCSYLLIGFWFQEKANADAGKKAFIVNRIGDFGFLIAMFILWKGLGTLSFREIAAMAPGGFAVGSAAVTLATLFLILGCTGKSAQIPLYTWLPDAMAGPTPVSALIHAATMVTAGVYLVARTNVLFALAPLSSTVLAGIGAATAIFAATIGLKQYDIKKVLAYSTVSQLGYMFLGVGTGAYVAGVFHLVTHAFFKALLFLGSGSVIHAMHHAYHATHSHDDAQDMRNMGGLRQYMPVTFWLMSIATLAIAGFPLLSGFFSKDEILAAAFARGAESPVYYLYWVAGLAAALCTAIYMARLITMTFLGENRTGAKEREHLHEAPWIMTGPLLVLGALSVLGGALNLPAFLGGGARLEHWLEPVVAPAAAIRPVMMPHGSTEYLLMAVAVAIGLGGLWYGWRMTMRSTLVPAAKAAADTGLGRVLFKKYYVDEIYDALIVRPLQAFSDLVLWKQADQGVIDGVVNGAASVARGLGRVGSWLQTGQVGLYVVLFLAGALYVIHAVTR
ncbi:MAG TPA: NADH-quinone oxidoreductase subunit L [Gemmatimonadales bacterium]|nr:NADH-quinone oxidoreductase subunit L [Gemmatimonadales bacterium]